MYEQIERTYKQAVAKLNAKEYDAAIIKYNKAIAIDSHCASAYYNRGITYKNVGNNIAFCFDFYKAADLGSEEESKRLSDCKGSLMK